MQPSTCETNSTSGQVRARPRMATVFGAAFLAGAVVAFGINRVLEVHLTQARPQVECEPIFVALRSLPQGAPITVWDVALRDWPKAMLPSSALRAQDSFDGLVLRHPLREGQPLVAAQLVQAASPAAASTASAAGWPASPTPATESWTPAQPAVSAADLSQAAAEVAAPAAAASAAPIAAAETVTPPTTPSQPLPAEPLVAAVPTAPPETAEPPAASEAASERLASIEPPVDDSTARALAAAADAVAAAPLSTDLPAAAAADLAADAAVEPASPSAEPTAPVAAATPAAVTDPAAVAVDSVADLPPVDAAVATVTDAVAALPPVATAPTLAEPWPMPNPGTPPLMPPVPMSPATDIEMPLASITATQPRPAARAESVLAANEPATPAPTPAAAPLRHLVVPERIALQADASFVNPQSDRTRGPQPQPSGRQAAATPRQRPRAGQPAPRATAPASETQRRPTTPAARQPAQGRSESAPAKAGGWLPKLGFSAFGVGTPR